MPPEKRERCGKSWAGPFREKALPILRKIEDEFAELFHAEKGRPNRPVELVVGVLLLKEMFDLTDPEALDALDFDARWWWAFEREPRELQLCQKTLHNFRVRLIEQEKSKTAFRRVTDELIGALGIKVSRQRLDSTQVLSNIAILSRLKLFCETMRVFLRAVKREDEKSYEEISEGIRKRYGEESRYADGKREQTRRRLNVAARDVWRLIERFKEHKEVSRTEAWENLARLFEEHCKVKNEAEKPKEDDDDYGEGGAPVELRKPKETKSDSMQTPHDPDVTYSRKKGQGFFVQVSETCVEENQTQMITDADVTPACKGDWKATVPTVERLEEAGHKPKELVADTQYGGAENAAELAKRGVNLTAPVPGQKVEPPKETPVPAKECPKEKEAAGKWLREQEQSEGFRKRYSIRAGIEATNSELKRAHGMKKLRVRRERRVKLAVYFKALACNVKRALRCWLEREQRAVDAAALA